MPSTTLTATATRGFSATHSSTAVSTVVAVMLTVTNVKTGHAWECQDTCRDIYGNQLYKNDVCEELDDDEYDCYPGSDCSDCGIYCNNGARVRKPDNAPDDAPWPGTFVCECNEGDESSGCPPLPSAADCANGEFFSPTDGGGGQCAASCPSGQFQPAVLYSHAFNGECSGPEVRVYDDSSDDGNPGEDYAAKLNACAQACAIKKTPLYGDSWGDKIALGFVIKDSGSCYCEFEYSYSPNCDPKNQGERYQRYDFVAALYSHAFDGQCTGTETKMYDDDTNPGMLAHRDPANPEDRGPLGPRLNACAQACATNADAVALGFVMEEDSGNCWCEFQYSSDCEKNSEDEGVYQRYDFAPLYTHAFDGSCTGFGLEMYDERPGLISDNPGEDYAAKLNACAQACAIKKTPSFHSWENDWYGNPLGILLGFAMKDSGNCWCAFQDSSNCTKTYEGWNIVQRYDFAARRPSSPNVCVPTCPSGQYRASNPNRCLPTFPEGRRSLKDYSQVFKGFCEDAHQIQIYAGDEDTDRPNPGTDEASRLDQCARACQFYPGFVMAHSGTSSTNGDCKCQTARSSTCNRITDGSSWTRYDNPVRNYSQVFEGFCEDADQIQIYDGDNRTRRPNPGTDEASRLDQCARACQFYPGFVMAHYGTRSFNGKCKCQTASAYTCQRITHGSFWTRYDTAIPKYSYVFNGFCQDADQIQIYNGKGENPGQNEASRLDECARECKSYPGFIMVNTTIEQHMWKNGKCMCQTVSTDLSECDQVTPSSFWNRYDIDERPSCPSNEELLKGTLICVQEGYASHDDAAMTGGSLATSIAIPLLVVMMLGALFVAAALTMYRRRKSHAQDGAECDTALVELNDDDL